ncbi:flavin reductase family protein [Rhodobacter sp. Har01]|uniref:flavin reductase family protein n=1 Tax=Rhodobacter sp. Har01 TaxID=2883999 RepID=UPI001D06072F|nr:flavin reductase family protein [Rhodobacter sp. Har01]MCB6177594.1 flavin reductase family protein [Rhodobacter sp. Har01]
MHYAPGREACPLPFSPFKACTVPRPIGWLSTVSAAGVANLAPYSQWQNLSFDPPMVMFAANPYSDGRRKHTVLNAEATGWFVWNMCTFAQKDAMNITAMEWPEGTDEFERAGLTKAPCLDAPGPRVAESPAHFECRYLSTHRLRGQSQAGWVDVVYGEVMRIHVQDEMLTPEGKLDYARIAPLARVGYHDYTVVRDTFPMPIPGASPAAAAGLEGKP